METRGIDDLLAQLRASAALAAGTPPPALAKEAVGGADFAGLLRGALDRVSESQDRALGLARDFEAGKGNVPVHEVMLSLQKANIAFQGIVQVRNRLVAAYQDIMNMQI